MAVERGPARPSRILAMASFDDASASLIDEIRRFRVGERLPIRASLLLWPTAGDPGVMDVDSCASEPIGLPKARVIRQRVASFVGAGGLVQDVLLPHEVAPHLAALAGCSTACVLLMQPTVACLAVVDGAAVRASYVSWVAAGAADTETARLLARYQLVARLVPHVRRWASQAPDARMMACGRFPDLRPVMVPIVEELDREIEVLDVALVGRSDEDDVDADETCGRQLAWALAASGLG